MCTTRPSQDYVSFGSNENERPSNRDICVAAFVSIGTTHWLITLTSDFANTCRTRLNTAPFDIPNKFIELAFYANSLYFWNTHKHRYHAMRKWYFRIKYGFVIKSSWHHLAEITIQYSFISSNIERPKSQRKNSTSTHHWTFSRFFFASSLNFAEDRLY